MLLFIQPNRAYAPLRPRTYTVHPQGTPPPTLYLALAVPGSLAHTWATPGVSQGSSDSLREPEPGFASPARLERSPALVALGDNLRGEGDEGCGLKLEGKGCPQRHL